MTALEHDLIRLTQDHPARSFQTQRDRQSTLLLIARQLDELGWRQLRAYELMPRHDRKLVALWKEQGIKTGTILNRLAALRWWARQVNRRWVLPASNAVYGLEKRSTVATVSKAQHLTDVQLGAITDPHVQMSVKVQQAFGLRRKECLMLRPHEADKGHYLELQDSWTKGKRPRIVPILTTEQRQVLDEAKALVQPGESLIPPDRDFRQGKNRYTHYTTQAGLHNLHGVRHGYAQERFEALAGYPAPVAEGPPRKAMTPTERAEDTDVRQKVSIELGHTRVGITATYTG